eukprot:TRINITY_DN22112_c0_g1_i2.p1 TRINITY_DN22112_c0_g1~~TRINITY_DN22112_c0_g1_i2.p1  ORF type:complete len:101 (+),score=4.01 TRINITY_DN22112_c0_g1_i2:64-366(+)
MCIRDRVNVPIDYDEELFNCILLNEGKISKIDRGRSSDKKANIRNSDDQQVSCKICTVSDTKLASAKCGHVACSECWKLLNTCPFCNETVKQSDLRKVFL